MFLQQHIVGAAFPASFTPVPAFNWARSYQASEPETVTKIDDISLSSIGHCDRVTLMVKTLSPRLDSPRAVEWALALNTARPSGDELPL